MCRFESWKSYHIFCTFGSDTVSEARMFSPGHDTCSSFTESTETFFQISKTRFQDWPYINSQHLHMDLALFRVCSSKAAPSPHICPLARYISISSFRSVKESTCLLTRNRSHLEPEVSVSHGKIIGFCLLNIPFNFPAFAPPNLYAFIGWTQLFPAFSVLSVSLLWDSTWLHSNEQQRIHLHSLKSRCQSPCPLSSSFLCWLGSFLFPLAFSM